MNTLKKHWWIGLVLVVGIIPFLWGLNHHLNRLKTEAIPQPVTAVADSPTLAAKALVQTDALVPVERVAEAAIVTLPVAPIATPVPTTTDVVVNAIAPKTTPDWVSIIGAINSLGVTWITVIFKLRAKRKRDEDDEEEDEDEEAKPVTV